MSYRTKQTIVDDIQAMCTSISQQVTNSAYKVMDLEEILTRLTRVEHTLTPNKGIYVDLNAPKNGKGTINSPLSLSQFNKKTTFGVVKLKGTVPT
jgi:hypothetical protein